MKTQPISSVSVFALAIAAVCIVRSARSGEVTYRHVPHADGEIAIDGRLDEPCWKESAAYPVHFLHGKKGVAGEEPLMLVRCLWDEQYLYVGYETFDPNVTAYGTGGFDGPGDNRREAACIVDGRDTPGCDVVEFFISWNSTTYMWELHHNAANCFSDIWCVALPDGDPQALSTMFQYGIYFGRDEFLRDDGTVRFACAAALKPRDDGTASTLNDPSDVDAGYSGELRFPWRAIGAPVAALKRRRGEPPVWNLADSEMRMLAVLQNPDTGARYHHDSPVFPGGWFHHGAAYWPRYRFDK